jgi:hypothetical protein
MSEKDASNIDPGLIRLRYKCKFEDEFGEPSDGWLDYIEAKCNEIFGNYSKHEIEALQRAFVARKRCRLNCAFDAIGFFCPDYPNMIQDSKKTKRKVTTKRSKVPKIQAKSTPQASEEILVKRLL